MNPALSPDALYAKSQIYIQRGFRAKETGDQEECQLWSSLALELLGKSTLAMKHPSLIADPQHYESLFAACNIDISPDVKTIQAKTLFARLGHLDKSFDTRRQTFCAQMALRRNAELHSGESPFSGMKAKAWEPEFWGAMVSFLHMQDKTLEQYLGTDNAKVPAEIVERAKKALTAEVEDRIKRASQDFAVKYKDPAQRAKAIEQPDTHLWWYERSKFYVTADAYNDQSCPACTAKAKVAGTKWNEEIVDDYYNHDDNQLYELVDIFYLVEEFYCPACNLRLFGTQEIEAANLPQEFVIHDERERQFEEEYNNE